MRIEICTNSYPSALAAFRAGADRIELCQNLEGGGITPSYGMLRQTLRHCGTTKVFVLIRPRIGDFCYSAAEQEVMRANIQLCKELGVAGIVLGALTAEGEVDRDFLLPLLDLAQPMEVTFHRAFDDALDPWKALDTIIDLGCNRLLTSGQATTAWQGRQLIKELVAKAADQILILPGAGISSRNAFDLVQYTGVQEIHLSAKATQAGGFWQTDEEEVRAVRQLFKPSRAQ